MTRVKICGIKTYQEAAIALAAGAWAVGEVFAPSSRQITPQTAADINRQLGSHLCKVGVFVNEAPAVVNEIAARCHLDMIQLHGFETPEYIKLLNRPVIKAFPVKTGFKWPEPAQWPVYAFLFDAYAPQRAGGTGQTFTWDLIKGFPAPFIVAGGLNPDNVKNAITTLSPLAVDVSSGVECPGQGKSFTLIKKFIGQVREV